MKQLSQLDIQQVSGGVDDQQPAISGEIDSPLPYIVQPIMPPRITKGPIGLEP
jgi:hypothetical protein